MNMKRVLAVIIILLIVISLTACKTKNNDSDMKENTTVLSDSVNASVEITASNIENTAVNTTFYENYTQEISVPTSSEPVNNTTQAVLTTNENYDDPGSWSIQRIVEEYKNAARKADSSAKSTQKITLKDINVNNGEHDKAISFVKPVIARFIESNSTESDGITGGFENLAAQDVYAAKAYKSGNDTVIEMVMKEQTAGADEDALSGSVGHAITTVGDIGEVVKDLDDMGLPLELSEDDTEIYYTNPVVNVVINGNGEIVSGTWSYTVEIAMRNFKAFGQNVEKASITMENIITV
ncbi:MAG: hypothetical protein IJ025_04955 [Clostridia bacterium]|nr:hypothetical protein [Clostridia bacterium]